MLESIQWPFISRYRFKNGLKIVLNCFVHSDSREIVQYSIWNVFVPSQMRDEDEKACYTKTCICIAVVRIDSICWLICYVFISFVHWLSLVHMCDYSISRNFHQLHWISSENFNECARCTRLIGRAKKMHHDIAINHTVPHSIFRNDNSKTVRNKWTQKTRCCKNRMTFVKTLEHAKWNNNDNSRHSRAVCTSIDVFSLNPSIGLISLYI